MPEETIQALVELGNVLRKVQMELWAQGYETRDGKLVRRSDQQEDPEAESTGSLEIH